MSFKLTDQINLVIWQKQIIIELISYKTLNKIIYCNLNPISFLLKPSSPNQKKKTEPWR